MPPPRIVDHDVTLRRPPSDHTEVLVGKFDGRSSGFVQQPDDVKFGAIEGLDGQITLPRARIRGDRDHGFEWLFGVEQQVAPLDEHSADVP
ncbi:MAG: hypothetical protein QM784_38345 [Polyangiaceae bacterium]